MSKVNFEELLNAGVHFGHLKRKWNPAMAPYIFDEKKGIHIIDLNKTMVLLDQACAAMKQIARSGKKILFVATKKQAKELLAERVKEINMPFVTERWTGGMLTNFQTTRKSIRKMTTIDKMKSDGTWETLNKRERLFKTRQREKLEKNFGSIADMTRQPAAIFIVDILKEHIALSEAKRLNIPTITNCKDMAITAADVNKLRQQTGAGMMDCKNALVEANGDFEAAIDILRKKGQKIAAKRGENEAREGLILAQASTDGKSGVILTLNCETDFVAKNDGYRTLVQSLVDLALQQMPGSIDELKALKYDDKLTVDEKITEQIGVIGEKLDLSSYSTVLADKVVAYNHPGNQLATLVGLNSGSEVAEDAGKQVAMQIAAMNPIAINKDGVDQRTIEREIEVGKELAIQEGKPADMAEKIAMGRLNKFFQENTLLSQSFVRDNKQTVEQFLNSSEKDLTVTDLTVTEFKRFSLS